MITLFKNRDLDVLDYFFEPYYKTDYTYPKIKVNEKEDGYELLLSVPGLSKTDINVTVDNREIKISHEKEEKNENSYFMRSFSKVYTLPDDVNESDVVAKLENGVLKLSLLKDKKKITKRTIEID